MGWEKPLSNFSLLVAVFALAAGATDIPDSKSFLRRVFASAAVLGDYVYIDGGEVSELINGVHPPSYLASYWGKYIEALRLRAPRSSRSPAANLASPAVNSTISISLKSSWTNSTVPLQATPKNDSPSLNNEAIWIDSSSDSLYLWSGAIAYSVYGRLAPANELWKFTADGAGGGSWAAVQPDNTVAFSQLVRPHGCAFCTINNVGYCMGGIAEASSDSSLPQSAVYALPGVVSYNFTSKAWVNASSVGFQDFGTLFSGASEPIPFGPNGLMLLLGGSQSPVGNTSASEYVDFSNLTFWDPATHIWYSQQTTGSRPTARQSFCTVGVKGPNGTYEIFLYGGVTQDGTTSDQVYVLSLPGFVFFQASQRATQRAGHTCVVVGKRQMLSIGGDVATAGYPDSILDPDPWVQGLGILDLQRMSWSSGYDANAADYASPDIVSSWYSQGGLSSVSWTSDAVKALFKESSGSSGSAGSNGRTPNNFTASSDMDDSTTSSTPVGAIAGGVVGGVVGLAAVIAVLIWLLRRRRAKNATLASHAWEKRPNATEIGTEPCAHQLPTDGPVPELSNYDQRLYGHYPSGPQGIIAELPESSAGRYIYSQ